MLGDEIRVGERGDAGDDDQIGRLGQFLNERVTGGDIRVGGLRVGDVGGVVEVAEGAFDVDEHGVIAVSVLQRLTDLVDAVGQHGRGDIVALQLDGIRPGLLLAGGGGEDGLERIFLRVRRRRGGGDVLPLQLLRLIEVDAVRRIDRVAAQVADARENEQPDQHHGQQRDQKRTAQRPFVAVGKNTHR